MDSEDFNKLKKLFEEFDGRPNHLAKFLLDSNAFSNDFIDNVSNSTSLIKSPVSPYFRNISEMNNWYRQLVDDLDLLKKKKPRKQIIEELENKLSKAILSENFEEACRIRDYMIKNGYKDKH